MSLGTAQTLRVSFAIDGTFEQRPPANSVAHFALKTLKSVFVRKAGSLRLFANKLRS